jgi:hypothetical protein
MQANGKIERQQGTHCDIRSAVSKADLIELYNVDYVPDLIPNQGS